VEEKLAWICHGETVDIYESYIRFLALGPPVEEKALYDTGLMPVLWAPGLRDAAFK